jgi:hypothetical protein
VARDSNAIELLGRDGSDLWLAVYQFGPGNENARIVRVPETAPDQAGTLGMTRSLDDKLNPNATGDLTVRRNGDGSLDVFVLATNNGLGAYRFDGLDLAVSASQTHDLMNRGLVPSNGRDMSFRRRE